MYIFILYKNCRRSTEGVDEHIIVGLFAAVGAGLVNMFCGSDVARDLETPAAE